MYQVTSSQLMSIWEKASALSAVERAETILLELMPELTHDALLALTIGERNLHLFNLRESLFGSSIKCMTRCQQCDESVEFTLDSKLLQVAPSALPETFSITLEQDEYTLRLINCQDILMASQEKNLAQAEHLLLQRCVLQINHSENFEKLNTLSEDSIRQLAEHLQRCDPNADIVINLDCPGCSCVWKTVFDIADFFWNEIHSRVKQLFNEIGMLAHAYGWSEADILALTQPRRHYYLNLIGS